MSNFAQRAITGFFFVLFLVGGILYNEYSLAALLCFIVFFGLTEIQSFAKHAKATPSFLQTVTLNFVGFLILLAVWLTYLPYNYLALLALLPFLMLLIEIYRNKATPFHNVAFSVFGFGYLVVPFASVLYLAKNEALYLDSAYHFEYVLGTFVLVWINDTGAYLTGRSFGKHKLFERLSPKKTWEGFAGGVALAYLASYFLHQQLEVGTLTHWLVIATIVAILGNLGDLAESMFKRAINIKDSGKILPGHGGILDRFDAVIFVFPFVLTYLMLANQ